MNERLKELAEKAGFTMDKYGMFWDEDSNNEGVDLDNFANLIIRECAEFVVMLGTEVARIKPEQVARLIMERFGELEK